MFRKLFKYDFKNIFRQMVPFYIVILGSALILLACRYLPDSMFKTIVNEYLMQSIIITLVCSVVFNTVIRAWLRLKHNFYGDESYLTHTLPVTKNQLFASKVVASLTVLVISAAISCISVLIVNLSSGFVERIIDAVNSMAGLMGVSGIVWGITAALLVILEIASLVFAGFFGYVIGNRFENKKAAIGFVFGAIAWGISQLIVFGCMIGTRIFWPDTAAFFDNGIVDTTIIPIIMYAGAVGYLISITLEYILTNKLLNAGVNVE